MSDSLRLIDAKGIALGIARHLIETAVVEARQRAAAVSIAVLDSGGHLVAFERLDGASAASAQIAIAKARTAALYGKPTSLYADALKGGNTALLTVPDMLAAAGGLPLIVGSRLAGAIGVSGSTGEVDEAVAACAAAVLAKLSPGGGREEAS